MTPRPQVECTPAHAYGTIERTSLRGVLVPAAAGIGKKKFQRRGRVTFMLAECSSLFSSLSPWSPSQCIRPSAVYRKACSVKVSSSLRFVSETSGFITFVRQLELIIT